MGCNVTNFVVKFLNVKNLNISLLFSIGLNVSDLRLLLNICSLFFVTIVMPINFVKSKCIRFGSRFNTVCANVFLNGIVLPWVPRLKYLGVTVVAGTSFKCDFSEARHKFFGSFNTIYGRVGNANSVSLLLSLLASICTPVLLFGTESSLGTTRRETESICSAYNKAWSKKFHTYDKAIILTVSIFAGICFLSTSWTCVSLYL